MSNRCDGTPFPFLSVKVVPMSPVPANCELPSAELDSDSLILPTVCYSLADQNVATTKSIGIYNFSVQLLKHLVQFGAVDQLTVLANPTLAEELRGFERATIREFVTSANGGLGRVLWDQWRVYQEAARSGSRWLFLPKGFASFARGSRTHLAAYVHDIMGDYYHRRFPGFEPWWEYQYFSRSLRATLRRADVIFTNTEFSRGEILDLAVRWRLPTPRVVVAGYGFVAGCPQPVPKENRVLLFASKVPHKRTDRAIELLDAWLKQTNFDGQVDCIGIFSERLPKPASRAWNWIGRVPPAQGRAMIRRSRVIVYVSEYEGFGMPAVEAVMEGTCPVYSDIPALREVMGQAGFAFSNSSAEDFAEAMQSALSVGTAEIDAWARSLLERHNWRAVVRQVIRAMT